MEPAASVACTLGLHDLRSQSERWRAVLDLAGRERIATDEGLRLVFANQPGVEAELRSLVEVENECCAWAAWHVTAQGDAVVMSARSTGEGVSTLHGMFLS